MDSSLDLFTLVTLRSNNHKLSDSQQGVTLDGLQDSSRERYALIYGLTEERIRESVLYQTFSSTAEVT